MEPILLKKGKIFHKRIQREWIKKAKGGKISVEHSIKYFSLNNPQKIGRLDVFVNETGDYVSVVEIKSTNWDKIKSKNVNKLIGSHRRQIWNYITKYLDIDKKNVCAGIIYPKSPQSQVLKKTVEDELNSYAIQVVWVED